ncbi:MAG: UTP--glucose-1-phosphate uridylyltransferase [Verrucomicrobia bacterium]|nr:UTP--glucose-1-phosphate uridylyltransferase [Verrucomicrobiota bacterium]
MRIIQKGKAGCIVLAGGLGTRLGHKGPKGTFPVSLVKKKTLFQLLFERIYWLQKKCGSTLPLALLVSSYNQEMTVKFLKKYQYFGLKPSQITFLEQKNIPYLNLQKKPLALVAPNGNGGFLEEAIESGLLDRWAQKGIEFIYMVPIDNPLADPFDAGLMDAMMRSESDVGVKAFNRDDPDEKVGIMVREKGKVVVKDYTAIPLKTLHAKDAKGTLKYPLGNTGCYCFRTSFLQKLAQRKIKLPVHWVLKEVQQGKKTFKAWKGEMFALDLLNYSDATAVISYPKETSFTPLKSRCDLKTMRKNLVQRDRRIFEELTGKKTPQRSFELSAEFLYPSLKLIKQWKGKSLPPRKYID